MSMLDPHPIPVVDAWYRVVLISAAAEMSIVGPVRYAPANIVSRTQLEPAWVSPADGLLHFAYTIATAGTPVRLELFDVRGRRLRSWSRIASEAGRYAETWDRRDGAGRRTARQVVVLRLSAGGVEAMRKIVVSR
jgi:hypothetical protein